MCAYAHIGAPFKVRWRIEKNLCAFFKTIKRQKLGKIRENKGKFIEKIKILRKKFENFELFKKFMHKNAIKIV